MRIETGLFVHHGRMDETVKDFIQIAFAGMQALRLNSIP